MLKDTIKCSNTEELRRHILTFDNDRLSLVQYNYDAVYYFSVRIVMGRKYSWYAFVDIDSYGVHPNINIDLKKKEVHKKIKASSREELIDKVLKCVV